MASQTSADLIAEYASLIPHWRDFLHAKRAEQEALLAEIQEEGVIFEEGARETGGSTPTPAENADDESDPVAWLQDELFAPATPSDAGAPTPPEAPVVPREGVGAGMPGATTFAQEEAEAGSRGPHRVEQIRPTVYLDNEGEAALVPDPLVTGLPDATTQARVTGEIETAALDPLNAATVAREAEAGTLARLVEQRFGETSSAFGHVLREIDEEELSWDLREEIRYAHDQEEIANAFVRAEREGQLPPLLSDAVRDLERMDFHFGEAARRLDNESPDDDPASYF